MNKNDLIERTRKFAIRVFKIVDSLSKSKATDVISYQLLKASSSVAANYRAATKAKSRSDFSYKMKIVLEEADESNFWLTFIKDLQLLKENKELDLLINESSELTAIFTQSVKTLNNS
jgi:four helix bundle protein